MTLTPIEIFPGYTFSSVNNTFTIPLADLNSVLTATEANATTGDGREIIRAIIEKVTAAIEGMTAAERPKFMTVTRGSIVGVNNTTIRRSFTITFEENITPAAINLKVEATS
jgi:hypothetical protein